MGGNAPAPPALEWVKRTVNGSLRGYAWAALAALAFSFEGLFARDAFAAGATPLLTLLGRFALAAALLRAGTLAAAAWSRGEAQAGPAGRVRPAPVVRPADRRALLLAGLGYAATAGLLFVAFERIATSLAILILYTYPALVALGAHLLGRERLTRFHAGALVLTFAGVALVGGAGGALELGGVLAAVAAALTNAATLLFQQPYLARVPASRAAEYTFVSAAAATLLVTAATGQLRLPPLESWPALLALAAGPSVVAVLAINRGVQLIGAARTAIVATLEPLFAAVWGAVWLGESFGPWQALGGFAILTGVTLLQAAPAAPAPGRPWRG